jgi:hypothetical protein
MVWPIQNESSNSVSPLETQSYLDFNFYLSSLEQYISLSTTELLDLFVAFYQRPFTEQFGHIISGPVFPGLVGVSEFISGGTLPLSIFYLGLSCLLSYVWLLYLNSYGLRLIWLLGLALAPNPIWFTLVISPDIIFAAFIAFFHYFYFKKDRDFLTNVYWLLCLLIILLTRPNGYSILLFVFVDFGFRTLRGDKNTLVGAIFFAGLITVFALYLYPYFITEARKSVTDTLFFNIRTSEYRAGLFPGLPEYINLIASLLTLGGAKILYFCGLRPSYGETSLLLVMVRSGAGFILLPGLIMAAIRAPRREQLFLAVFFLPIFFGPTQDRYNLPLFAILFRYGAEALEYLLSVLQRSPLLARFTTNQNYDSKAK